ncbi:hypothetical protein [Spirosoma litoris]
MTRDLILLLLILYLFYRLNEQNKTITKLAAQWGNGVPDLHQLYTEGME